MVKVQTARGPGDDIYLVKRPEELGWGLRAE